MKIGIIGTRGIPNHYGGFEQFAEQVAVRWVEMGHEVIVYNSHRHPFQERYYKGVQIVHCYDPEYKIGTAGQFIYDLNCILHARKQKLDIFLQLGYTSSSIWSFLMPKKSVIVTNMDGLEWKRSKYSNRVQSFLKRAENWAINGSDVLVADSIGIQQYLKESYGVESTFIAYGSDVVEVHHSESLADINLSPFEYHLVIARLEPENSIEMILDGFVMSNTQVPMVVVGNHFTRFGEYLKIKYQSQPSIRFVGGIYDAHVVNQLRSNCDIYFHGHTVGGTNPSLIEAMGCGAFICAHNNIFNQSVLQEEGRYFEQAEDIARLIREGVTAQQRRMVKESHQRRVQDQYNWIKIAKEYLTLFKSSLDGMMH